MRSTLLITVAVSLVVLQHAIACDGGGSRISSRSSGSRGFSTGATFSGPARNIAMASAQINAVRQQSAVSAAAYRARMYPIRLANATKARSEKLAKRQARTDIRIAKLQAKQRAEEAFAAKSRTWLDSTGKHTVQAIFVQSSGTAVQLQKADGSLVTVPVASLSTNDRDWVLTQVNPRSESGATMLVGIWN